MIFNWIRLYPPLTDYLADANHSPGVGDGQGGLVCCDSWGPKESDPTEGLNCTELKTRYPVFILYI